MRTNETVRHVRTQWWVRASLWGVLPLVGTAALLFLHGAAHWLLALPWTPLRGPLELIAAIPQPWGALGAAVVGGLGGLILAGMCDHDRTDIEIGPQHASIRRGAARHELARNELRGILVDRNELVALRPDGDEALRQIIGRTDAVRHAFAERGWPVLDSDPHAEEFRLWVGGDDSLPPGADVLLTARAKALGNSVFGEEEAALLRTELGKLGVLVRQDAKRKQYWRTRPRRPDAESRLPERAALS